MLQIDDVEKPSWQAQIKGSKLWTLQPAPECYFECDSASIQVTVQSGDISMCHYLLQSSSYVTRYVTETSKTRRRTAEMHASAMIHYMYSIQSGHDFKFLSL